MTTSQVLQHLYSLDNSSPYLLRYLYCLMRSDEEEHYLSSLRGSELARLVDFLDEALDAIPGTDQVSRQCLHKLQAICGQHMTLPSSHNVSGDLTRVGDHPIASGGFADVWEGIHGDRKVCIKFLRLAMNNYEPLAKSFYREAVIWKRLRHPNIVPFIGVTSKPLQFVSEYMSNGTLTEYVGENTGANRIGLLLDVAEGLNYLHTNYTIHGDLKGPNILVDCSGRARLTDFGLASVARRLDSILVTQVQGYSIAWAAPEILEKGDRSTQEGDIFAFGMVGIEVFTGRPPFSGCRPLMIMSKIQKGERPNRPQEAQELGLSDLVWDMVDSCWQQDPGHRPTITDVVELLRECYMLRVANPSFTTLSPRRPVENTDDAASNPPIPPMPTDGKPTSAKPSGTSQRSGRPSSRTHEISADPSSTLNVLHPGIPRSSPGPSRELLSDEPRPFSTSAHIDNHEAQIRINQIAEELACGSPKSKGKATIELRRLCGHNLIIPTSYELHGVMKEGDYPQRISRVAEIWKGRYNNEVVALTVLRAPRGGPDLRTIKIRFYKEVVLMKQVEHNNILPFYGVTTIADDFCMVSPWYENGNIMDHLKKNPATNRFDLLLDVVHGLRFLHDSCFVHGALRPSHVLIDDNGAARLATRGRSSIVAVPGTSTAGHMQSGGDIDHHRYSAPEIQWPEDHDEDRILITKESDVYGIGMVAYEVLTGNMPYFKWNDTITLQKIQAGEMPQQPSVNDDEIWEFLRRCWSRDPKKRPSTTQVFNVFSQFRSLLQAIDGCEGPGIEEVRGRLGLRVRRLKLRVRSIKILLDKSKPQYSFVKFKYGTKDHTTSPTTKAGGGPGEYTWNDPESWLMEVDEQYHEQLVSFEVLRRTSSLVFKRVKACGTGNFSLLGKVNKKSHVVFEAPESIGLAVLKISLETF